jgi:hypothetical protein
MARFPVRAALVLLAAMSAAGCDRCARLPPQSTAINDQPIRLDPDGKLLAAPSSRTPYAAVAARAWDLLKRIPAQDNGLPTFYSYARFDPETFEGIPWPHNPAGLYAMLTESALLYYAYSGDRSVVDLVAGTLDHVIAHGMTAEDFDWRRVPYASADPGSVEYSGADDDWCDGCGRGDGAGVIEPDKVGELGYAYARFYELTDEARYLEAAIACADALASHVREGDERTSPWPFRVRAETNEVREGYTADVLGPVMLFDELARLGEGDLAAYAKARDLAWAWMLAYPMQNDAWSGYFEDIPIQTDPADNVNQLVPLQTARYILEHPEYDADWRDHVSHILSWVQENFGCDANDEQGEQFGAIALSEQTVDMAKMGSHTARFAAVNALYWEKTGDLDAKERAFRGFNWASYMCSPTGVVAVGEDKNEGWWFTDGYGDYIRQFMTGLAAVPEWAPPDEDHVLRSSSVVRSVEYGPRSMRYETFDEAASETLKLSADPVRVVAGDQELARRADLDEEGYTVMAAADGGVVVRVRHDEGAVVEITTR